MTDLKIGDRVKVEFESVVTYIYSGQPKIGVEYPYDDTELVPVPLSSVTKLVPQLPTAVGSVIRIPDFRLADDSGTAMLTLSGWRFAEDTAAYYQPRELVDQEWETIYIPGVTK